MAEIETTKLVLEELRRTYDKVYSASDALDAKLYSLFNFSSLVVGFAGALQISTLTTLQSTIGYLFWLALLVVLLLYAANFVVIMRGLAPRVFDYPITGDREKLRDKYLPLTEIEAHKQLISNHLESSREVVNINNSKARAVTVSTFLLGAISLCLILAVPLGLLVPHPTFQEFWQMLGL